MKKIWLEHYPAHIPAGWLAPTDQTLVDLIDNACVNYAEKKAFSSFNKTITYAEFYQLVNQFSSFLREDLEMKKGDRLAIMLPNILQFPVVAFAAWRAGLVLVTVNPLYTASELEHQLDDSGATGIVILANQAHVLERVIENTAIKHVVVTEVGDLLGAIEGRFVNVVLKYFQHQVPEYSLPHCYHFSSVISSHYSPPDAVAVHSSDLAMLQYTGGTTGVAKGVMLSHGNLMANVEQLNIWLADQHVLGEECALNALPLYHIYSLTCNCLLQLLLGSESVLIIDPRRPAFLVKALKRHNITTLAGVDTLYRHLNNLLQQGKLLSDNFASLKLATAGGMPLNRKTAAIWQDITGVPILEGYGLSETSPVVSSNLPASNILGTIGLPLPATEISIRDDEDIEVSIGSSGELCVRGPQVMHGYWQQPETNSKVFTEDGFLRTGDIATIDEQGYLRIVDRKKDMIIVSGFKIYPNEIENVLLEHPLINQVACVGIEDAQGYEQVAVFIVVAADSSLDKEAVKQYSHRFLADYKVPKIIEFKDELPLSNVGKVLRRQLQKDFTGYYKYSAEKN